MVNFPALSRTCFFSAIVGCACANAGEWFVSPQGSDQADGSLRSPWQSLQRAVRRDSGVRPGDNINLLSGVYRERVTVEVGGRGTSWNDAEMVTIRPALGDERRVTFKGVHPATLPWKRWKGNVYYLEGVRDHDHRFLLQSLAPEAVPPDEPPTTEENVKLAQGAALLYVPLKADEARYWLQRKDFGPDTLRPGESLRQGDKIYVSFQGIDGRPPDPTSYQIQTPFHCPVAFAPGVSFVRISGIRFTLYGSSMLSIAENTGVHHLQVDHCDFSWNQSRGIDLHETGEHGSLFLRVLNNHFRFMNQEAIQLGADHCLIRGNEFERAIDPRWLIRRDSGIAVRVIGNFNVVEYNYIHDYLPINGRTVTAIDLEAGNPLPLNPSHTLVRYNVIENPRPATQDILGISLSIQHDCARNQIHHNLILNPGMGVRLIAPKRENYFFHNTIVGAQREGLFFQGTEDPLGEYHEMQSFNSARSPAANVFQNNVFFQSNGRDFEQLWKVEKGYRRGHDLGPNRFLANHWSAQATAFGEQATSGDPRLQADYGPRADSSLLDSGAPLSRTTRAGTGIAVPVTDSRYFSDGHGIAEPDLIQVGNNEPQGVVRVDVATHTLYFARPMRWEQGAAVSFPWMGGDPDRGAIERSVPWPHLDWLPDRCPLRRGGS